MCTQTRAGSQAILGTVKFSVDNFNPWDNEIRALTDTGSQINLLTKKIAKKLELKIEQTRSNLVGVQMSTTRAYGYVYLNIKVPNDDERIKAKFLVVNQITRSLPVSRATLDNYPELSNLKLADPTFGEPGEIDALIGINLWVRILQKEAIKSNDGLVAAQQTTLGWVIYKREKDPIMERSYSFHTTTFDYCNSDLEKALLKFWKIEDVPTAIALSPEDRECEKLFESTHSRDSDGRYVVYLPFNSNLKKLGKSKSIAMRQFFAIERRMVKDTKYRNDYHAFIKECIDLGHLDKINEPKEEGYYTPHLGVETSNKFRVVLNASCPTSSSISLNDCQLNGPKLQKDLSNILMNFRKFEIGMTADVVKMFRQIKVAESHQKYQKILWRFSDKDAIAVYQFNRVIYGQKAAPYLSARVLKQCALDHKKEFPIGAKTVLETFYVDDGLMGADTIEEAITMKNQVTDLLKKGQLELAKWASNRNTLVVKNGSESIEFKDPEITSVLGIRWVPSNDIFVYKVKTYEERSDWTKREILSEVGSLYDPNGYISPVIVVAKIIMQKIWQHGTQWDDQVPEILVAEWNNFILSLEAVKAIKIPRWLGMAKIEYSELHTFTDASERAYAAVTYVKTITTNGQIRICLVQSKTRVAPVKEKKVPIPRLELCGAHLGAKLADSILIEFGDQIRKSFYWTDSEIVLCWLRKSSCDLKTFVSNRVAAIQSKTIEKGFHWYWVPGKENPADLASRGLVTEKLCKSDIWWNGPKWLRQEEKYWPKRAPKLIENDLVTTEYKFVGHLTTEKPIMRYPWYKTSNDSQTAVPLLKAYGSFTKLKRVMATIMRAVHNFSHKKKNCEKLNTPLSREEINNALQNLIRMDQRNTFLKEINELGTGETNKNNWLDEKKILRLNGRVQSDNLTFDEQFPVLLSHNGDLAPLILREAHIVTMHGGAQLMLQTVRQQYWIYKSRFLAKKIISQCKPCFRYRIKLAKQLMAKLPEQRTRPQRPFSICGVDFMGPVGVISRAGRNPSITKGYVCVFVCFCTRAVHLELVSNETTPSFLQALRRIIAQRGSIKTIWSDNGSNFVGANNYLKKIYSQQEQWAYDDVPNNFQIEWKFNTPSAPHHGGLHEAAVKSTKHHLRRVIGEQNLTFEEYQTLLKQIEACVNSRPISPLSDDPNDMVALTPSHFLIGEPLVTLIESRDLTEINPGRLKRHEMVQQMYQSYWKRWHHEYIVNKSQRSKWLATERNIKVGDLVLMYDEKEKPSHWLLGRIKEVYTAPDGLVRSALIATIHGEYKRPITKIGCLLPEEREIQLSNLNPKVNFERLTQHFNFLITIV